MDIQDIVNSALYASYVFNRQDAPDRPYTDWKVVFGDKVEEFETLYRLEEKWNYLR